jgi:CHAT domain-containing protein/tetratricopeptide (TPR) repeat protein
MFKRIVLILSIVLLSFLLSNAPVEGQTKEDGLKIAQEGEVLQRNARSTEDLSHAVEKYEQALKIFEGVKFDRGIAAIANNLGALYDGIGDYRKAVEYYKKSLEVRATLGDARGYANTLRNLGQSYLEWGEYTKALKFIENSLKLYKEVGDDAGQAGSFVILGTIYAVRGQTSEALECYGNSLRISRSIGEARIEGVSLMNLGNLSKDRGNYLEALEYYEESLEIAKRVGDASNESTILHALGNLSNLQGKYDKAAEYYKQSMSVAAKLGDARGVVRGLTGLGYIYSMTGRYSEAADHYKMSLKIFGDLHQTRELAFTLGHLGNVYRAWGDHEKALMTFQQAVDLCKKIGVSPDEPMDLIGNLYLDMDDVGKAEPFIRKAGSDSSFARFYFLKSDLAQAKDYYEKVRRLADENRRSDHFFIAYTGLGMVSEKSGNYEEALVHYETAMRFAEEVRSSLAPEERLSFFDVRLGGFKRSDPAKGRARILMILNRPEESIEPSETTRARAFADKVVARSDREIRRVPEDVIAKLDLLATHLAASKKRLHQTDRRKNPEGYRNLGTQIGETTREQEHFIDILWEKYPAYAAVKYPKPLPLKQAEIRPHEYVIVYDLFDTGVGIKLIKGNQVVLSWIEDWPLKELESEVNGFRAAFEGCALIKTRTTIDKEVHEIEKLKVDMFDRHLAHLLYKRLLEKALQHVTERPHVTIIPDGVLATLPFEALIVKQEDGGQGKQVYVGDLYPISYVQSLTVLTLSRTLEAGRSFGNRTLVIADPVFGLNDERASSTQKTPAADAHKGHPERMIAMEEGSSIHFRMNPLRETALLAANLERDYGSKCDIYSGFRANKKVFMEEVRPHLKDYRQVVFATHGLFSNKIPGILEPFLALTMVPPGTDGLLKMSDVIGLEMTADIVALTACQTGLGHELSGEGVMSMGRAFQFAGARSVIMSLWSVGETASVKLMTNFFRHLKVGKTKLEALKAARDEIRVQGYDHPYFWAAFVLVGNVDQGHEGTQAASSREPFDWKHWAQQQEKGISAPPSPQTVQPKETRGKTENDKPLDVRESLKQWGVPKGLELEIERVPIEIAEKLGLKKGEGVRITAITKPGGSLRVGDVIVEVDGKPIYDVAAFNDAFAEAKRNGLISLRTHRGPKEWTIKFTLH